MINTEKTEKIEETENKRNTSLIFIDWPNIRHAEINKLKKKIDYIGLIQFLFPNKDEKLIVTLYYTSIEKEGVLFKQLPNKLRENFQALVGPDFILVELDKDVDSKMINDMWFKFVEDLENNSLPKKITLFSGDHCFACYLGKATRSGIETTVVAEEGSCAEILKEVSTRTIFLSDFLIKYPELVKT